MLNEEEFDIFEEIENRVHKYVEDNNCTPDAVVVSTQMFKDMLYQLAYQTSRPFGGSLNQQGMQSLEIISSMGRLKVYETKKYGDEFFYVGLHTDIFPNDGELDIAEDLLLNGDKE